MKRSMFNQRPRMRAIRARVTWASALLALFLCGLLLTLVSGATAAVSAVDLGTATSFAVLAGTPNITDVPTSVITGDVGLSPATGVAIGIPCAEVTGTVYSVDATGPACQMTDPGLLTTAKTDLTTAYTNAANKTPSTALAGGDNQLGGLNLGPGVYNFGLAATANLTGNLILTGSATDVWVFQASDSLVTASSSSITFAGGAQACNVFWQVSSQATLGSNSDFAGTIMALDSIVVHSGVTIDGRVLARNGQVTLNSDTIKRSDCATPPTTSTSTSTSTTTTTTKTTAAATTTPTATTPTPAALAAAAAATAAANQAVVAESAENVAVAAQTAAIAAAARADVTAAKAAAAKAAAAATKARIGAVLAARFAIAAKVNTARVAAAKAARAATAAKAAAVKAAAAARLVAAKPPTTARPATTSSGFTG